MVRSIALLLLSVLGTGRNAEAQASPATATKSHWEVGALLGAGPSVVTEAYGGVPKGGLLTTSVYVTHPVLHWKGLAAGFYAELSPLVIMTKVPRLSGSWFPGPGPLDSTYVTTVWDSGAVAGIGLQPVGFRFSQKIGSKLLTYGEASGGGIVFARAVPEPGARSLNFLVSGGLGVGISNGSHRSYLVGYRFTHISNAYTAASNPGYNAHVIYVGLTLR